MGGGVVNAYIINNAVDGAKYYLKSYDYTSLSGITLRGEFTAVTLRSR